LAPRRNEPQRLTVIPDEKPLSGGRDARAKGDSEGKMEAIENKAAAIAS
jgi:hypothetical protein